MIDFKMLKLEQNINHRSGLKKKIYKNERNALNFSISIWIFYELVPNTNGRMKIINKPNLNTRKMQKHKK